MSGSQNIIQADYDPLTQIAQHYDDCGQHVQAGYATLVNQIDRLRVGEWKTMPPPYAMRRWTGTFARK